MEKPIIDDNAINGPNLEESEKEDYNVDKNSPQLKKKEKKSQNHYRENFSIIVF